jgi:hypothetical protein
MCVQRDIVAEVGYYLQQMKFKRSEITKVKGKKKR